MAAHQQTEMRAVGSVLGLETEVVPWNTCKTVQAIRNTSGIACGVCYSVLQIVLSICSFIGT